MFTTCSRGLSNEKSYIPAKADLIFYYSCDKSDDGKPLDLAQGGVDARFSAKFSSLTDGPFGKALACFGNANQEIVRESLYLGTNDFTLAFWVNVSGYMQTDNDEQERRGFLVHGHQNHKLWVFLNDSGTMSLHLPDADNASMSALTVLPRNRWIHLAFVVDRDDDAQCRVYMNGLNQPLGEVNMATGAGVEYDIKDGFIVGRALVGQLDEIAVYAKALSEKEVRSMAERLREGLAAMVDSPVTEEDTLPPERKPFRLKNARKEAARKTRRIIYNDDGGYVFPFDTPEKFIGVRLKQTFGTQVDTVFFNVGATTIFTFDNDVGETYGEFVTEKSPPWPHNLKKGIEGLRKTGDGTAGVALEYCRKHGIEYFLSLRMNDIHDSFMPFMLSQWKRDRRQYLFSPNFLNYEFPEVRDYVYRIVESFCKNFDVDGIELDWWRGPRAFPPSWDGEPLHPYQVEMMNNLMRRIRIMTERIGEERGRPILLSTRIPMSVERSLFLGFDLKTWFDEDLLDLLVLGGGYAPMAMVTNVQEMVAFARPYGAPVYACVSGSAMNNTGFSGMGHHYFKVEAWRGVAMNMWHAGVDGVYTFNFFPRQNEESVPLYQLFDQMGSPETLRGHDKIFAIDRMPIHQLKNKNRWAMVAPDRLPITLGKEGWTQAKLPVGEDIVANTPAGKTCTATLRIKPTALDESDTFMIRLNGKELGEAERTEALSDEPGEPDEPWLEMKLDPMLVQEGYNIIEVKLATQHNPANMPTIDRFYLTVRYQ